MDRNYTLKDMMTITGLSKRTLHYYDHIGLLPAKKEDNGYRYYQQTDLLRLQRILFLKAFDFSIKEIKDLLALTDNDLRLALQDHESKLKQKIRRLQKIKEEVQRFLAGVDLIDLDLYQRPLQDQYEMEADLRYGETSAYQTYLARQTSLSLSEKEATHKAVEQKLRKIFKGLDLCSHLKVEATEVRQLVQDWKATLLTISDFDDQVLVHIAKAYEQDPRFKQYFKQYTNPHLPSFIAAAVAHTLGSNK